MQIITLALSTRPLTTTFSSAVRDRLMNAVLVQLTLEERVLWMIGGVGEWMYRSLGGIAPASPGYATVSIAPQISPTLDPASVNASVTTVRGVVTSNWERHSHSSCVAGRVALATMHLGIPVGIAGEVTIPLLGRSASQVNVAAAEVGTANSVATTIWDGSADSMPAALEELPWLHSLPAATDGGLLMLGVGAVELELVVSSAC